MPTTRSALLIFAFLCALAPGSGVPMHSAEVAGRPNVVMIVVDDMRFDEWGAGFNISRWD